MKMYIWILSFVFIAIISGCSSDSNSVAKINNLKNRTNFDKKELDTIFKYSKELHHNTQLSIAKIQNGKINFYGVVRRNDNIETIDNYNKVFKIGSLTKIFTSTLLAQMVMDGKLNLDDNIQDKLQIQLHNNTKITYKQLSNHTSGLPSFPKDFNESYYNSNNLENYLKNTLELTNKQNKFNYSNLGVAILAYTITHIENKSYEELLQENILKKLSMNNTTTIENKIAKKLILATDIDYAIAPAMESVGGIFSSVEDLTKFAIASFDKTNETLKLTQKETFADGSAKMGLGWAIHNPKFTETLHYHEGLIGGYISSIVLDIKNKNGIIILSNQSSFDDIGLLSTELMKLM